MTNYEKLMQIMPKGTFSTKEILELIEKDDTENDYF